MNKFKKGDKVNIHDGSYAFGIQNRFCNPVIPNRTIVFDGKTVILSHKSFLALREQLV